MNILSNITISQITTFIIALAAFIGALTTICNVIKNQIEKGLDKIQAPFYEKINKMDILQCRIFLINHLEEKLRNVEKSEYEEVLAHEIYEHYTNDLKSNSYVHDLWNKVYK